MTEATLPKIKVMPEKIITAVRGVASMTTCMLNQSKQLLVATRSSTIIMSHDNDIMNNDNSPPTLELGEIHLN